MTFALRKLKEGMARNCRLIDEWVQGRYIYRQGTLGLIEIVPIRGILA